MDLSWLPESLRQVRLLWESVYDKSPPLAYFVIIAIFTFPFYLLHVWSKFGRREKQLYDKVKEARERSKKQQNGLREGDEA